VLHCAHDEVALRDDESMDGLLQSVHHCAAQQARVAFVMNPSHERASSFLLNISAP
jgi:hypothetical protein